MFAVRYVALAALVVWIGGQLTSVGGQLFDRPDLLAYACGAIIVVALLVMKFVGPPPHAFAPRFALVVLMLAIAAATGPRARSAALTVNLALGAVLLFWYVRE
jgi:hypothetical protein